MVARSSRAVRAGAVGGAILLLIALVAVASGNERPEASAGVTDLGRLSPALDAVFTIALTLYAAMLVFTIWVLWPDGRRRSGPPPRAPRMSLPAFLLFVLLVWLAIYFRPERVQEFVEPLADLGEPRGGVPQRDAPIATPDGRGVEFEWPIAFALALAICGFAAFAYARARARATASTRRRVEDDLVAVVEATIEDVRRERDPRRAVIAAYAQMEDVLARHGLPRKRSEAPFEYLARILRELRVRASAVLALTELFERARFSQHEVDEEMKEEAIDALGAVRADLRAAA